MDSHRVLIPDTWGKSSDTQPKRSHAKSYVLIPDEWGKSSDMDELDAMNLSPES